MTLSPAHGGQKRFLPTTRSSALRFQTVYPRMARYNRLAASGGFHSDHVGATDATAAPAAISPSTGSSPSLNAWLLHFITVFGHLRGHASSLAQHLQQLESISPSLRLQLGTRVSLPDGDGVAEAGGEGVRNAFHSLQLRNPVPHVQLRHGRAKSDPSRKQYESQEQHNETHLTDAVHKLDGGQLLVTLILSRIPWNYRISPQSTDSAGAGSTQAAFPASYTPPHSQLRHGDMHQYSAAHTLGMAVLWHSAVSLQRRVVVTALWHMGHAVEVADKARKNLPPPAEVPGLVHWGAVAAAACAEETVALALARTATVASVAAAGVPAALAPAVSAPHLPVLHHARARLLSAATSTLERLRGLQRGCTTHVLLRFLLFSALNPRLRRDMGVRLDVLARRAAQVAILQEQHDSWQARQLVTASTVTALSTDANTHAPTTSGVTGAAATQGSSRLTPSPASSSGDSPFLAARWYHHVFAPEMLACARQLKLEIPSCPPDDHTAGDPPGRFDLRDLYRLIRVLEIAVEDLEQYNL